MDERVFTIALLILAGLFSFAGGALDWDFFMRHRKAAFLVDLFGRNAARVFYVVLGLFLAGTGLVLGLGLVLL